MAELLSFHSPFDASQTGSVTLKAYIATRVGQVLWATDPIFTKAYPGMTMRYSTVTNTASKQIQATYEEIF